MTARLSHIAQQFTLADVQDISALGNGLINDTFQVRCGEQDFVLQRLNSHVFGQPQQVIANGLRLKQHIDGLDSRAVQLQIPGPLTALNGQAYVLDDGQCWRALPLIGPSESREQLSNEHEAQQVGFALAHFHGLCRDLPGDELFDTLPGFHITPHYLHQFDEVLVQSPARLAGEIVTKCLQFIEQQRIQADCLEQAKQQGELQQRVIHGDPKLNNFLFQPGTDRIISLIDLDTVKPGLVHYDLGDCLRSCCHIAGDRFDLQRCASILTAYCAEADFLSAADYHYLYDAIWLIPFELGLRFFTDYLQGDVYFKVQQPEQNLLRAQAQFALCRDIQAQQSAIMQLIARLR